MPFFLTSQNLMWYNFDREIPTLQMYVDSLNEAGVDMIVVLSHCGIERDTVITHQIKGITVLVSGFDGRGLREPYEDPYTHTIVVRGYGGLSEVGRLDLWFDREHKVLKKYRGKLISLLVDEVPPDPKWLKFKVRDYFE
jgi:5'-nucleotidase